jgi:5-methylcytosine-specific restriction endonuclease McrA
LGRELEEKQMKRVGYDREWLSKRRKSFFEGKACLHCGSIERLELHHINPKTKEHHAIWSWREERRINELSKCIVLCNSCHKIETAKYATLRRKEHGRGGYSRGCRCEICYKSQQSHNAERYKK